MLVANKGRDSQSWLIILTDSLYTALKGVEHKGIELHNVVEYQFKSGLDCIL